jgi:phosphatidylglycerophosphatase C
LARLAVFDLDGTITRHDTLASYVIGLLRKRPWRLLRLLRIAPAAFGYWRGRLDRGALKARFLQVTLGRHTRTELQGWADQFVSRLLARGVRSDALRAIEAHRREGDVLVLLSASPDLYVPQIAARLGFDEVICTGLSWTAGHLDGALTTPNRQGAEKTRCISELAARHPGQRIAAYANALADLDHLRRADEPLLVCGSRRARREATRAGIPLACWR